MGSISGSRSEGEVEEGMLRPRREGNLSMLEPVFTLGREVLGSSDGPACWRESENGSPHVLVWRSPVSMSGRAVLADFQYRSFLRGVKAIGEATAFH